MNQRFKEFMENLWYHEKGKLIGGTAVLVTIASVFFFNSWLGGGNEEPDIQVAYVTNGPLLTESMEKGITQSIAPAVKDLNKDGKIVIKYVPLLGPKAELGLIVGDFQMFVLNKSGVKTYMEQEALEPLDRWADKLKLEPGVYAALRQWGGYGDGVHVYALPISSLGPLGGMWLAGDDYYLAVRRLIRSTQDEAAKQQAAFAIMDRLADGQ